MKNLYQNKSVEEKIEDSIKSQLTELNLKYYTKTEMINPMIEKAFKDFPSKTGGKGGNYPDIKLLIDDIPVVIEVKGSSDKHIKYKLTSSGLTIDLSNSSITHYAVNGAVHYAYAILTYCSYEKVVTIGVSGNNTGSETIWSYIVTRDEIIPLKELSNQNDLAYLCRLGELCHTS